MTAPAAGACDTVRCAALLPLIEEMIGGVMVMVALPVPSADASVTTTRLNYLFSSRSRWNWLSI
jgi:hypothetical protein